MFEKLFLLVKNNAGAAVINNPDIPEKYHDAVINEASSSIIEVLKGQMEMGMMKDLISFFQLSGMHNKSIVKSIVNRFANKLNNFYGIDPVIALRTANALIKPVMAEMVEQSKNETNVDFGLTNLLSKLTGGERDMSGLVNQMMLA